MPTNEFNLNADFMVPVDVFQAITLLAIADQADTQPVTFECLNGVTEKEGFLLNLTSDSFKLLWIFLNSQLFVD